MKKLSRSTIALAFSLLSVVVMEFTYISPAFAISAAQTQLFREGIHYFNIDNCSTNAASLTGDDAPSQVWNYFKAQGVDDMHIAAIMGNLAQESHYSPTIMQKGGNSNNPSEADPLGWGIVQWSPGSKVIATAGEYGITGNIYELSTQLQIVWAEMNDTTPAGYHNFLPDFISTTTLEEATAFFTTNYEAAGVSGDRVSPAREALARYGGGTVSSNTTSDTSSCAGNSAYISPECTNATGVAKILCAAKAYDTASYYEGSTGGHQGGAAWHSSCPSIGADCYLDCSGLVNISVYDITGGQVDMRGSVSSIPNQTQYWKNVTFTELQPGDILVKIPDGSGANNHVEIVDHVEGQRIITFGSHSANRPQVDQIGPGSFTNSSDYQYYHYIGPGV